MVHRIFMSINDILLTHQMLQISLLGQRVMKEVSLGVLWGLSQSC